jgi:hypothetical protein
MTTGKRDPYAHFRKQNPIVVDEEQDSGEDILCHHPGCTSRWTVQGPYGIKCSKHYWMHTGLERGPVKTMRDWTGPQYPGDMMGWARRLKDAHEAGWPLTEYQVSCYKTALRIE